MVHKDNLNAEGAMTMQYTILKIMEEDYGCEGIPEDEELMCSVLVRDENGCEKWLKLANSYLTSHNLNIGSVFTSD